MLKGNSTTVIVVLLAGLTTGGCDRLFRDGAPAVYVGSLKDTSSPHDAAASRPTRVRQASVSRQAAAEVPGKPAPGPTAVVMAKPAAPVASAASAVTSAPSAASTPPPQPSKAGTALISDQLMEEGRRLFQLGKVLDARNRFVAAMDGPAPHVLLALARSFDPHYLAKLPSPDAAPDLPRARSLYELAAERGSEDAGKELERIAKPVSAPGPAPAQATPISVDAKAGPLPDQAADQKKD